MKLKTSSCSATVTERSCWRSSSVASRFEKLPHARVHQPRTDALQRRCDEDARQVQEGLRWTQTAIQSFEPPSTRKVSPVIQRAASEARNTIAAAMSSG